MGRGWWEEWVKGVKRHNLPVLRRISPGDCNAQHGNYCSQKSIVYLEVEKRAHLRSSHQKKKKFVTMRVDGF